MQLFFPYIHVLSFVILSTNASNKKNQNHHSSNHLSSPVTSNQSAELNTATQEHITQSEEKVINVNDLQGTKKNSEEKSFLSLCYQERGKSCFGSSELTTIFTLVLLQNLESNVL